MARVYILIMIFRNVPYALLLVLLCEATKRPREDENDENSTKIRALGEAEDHSENFILYEEDGVSVSVPSQSVEVNNNNNDNIIIGGELESDNIIIGSELEENKENVSHVKSVDQPPIELQSLLLEIKNFPKGDPSNQDYDDDYFEEVIIKINEFIFQNEDESTRSEIEPFFLAYRISLLYDAFIENNMTEFIGSIFHTALSHPDEGGVEMNPTYMEEFANSLVLLNFEGWTDLINACFLEQKVDLFSFVIKVIPKDEKLRRLIFTSFGIEHRSPLEDECLVPMLYYFITSCGISIDRSEQFFSLHNLNCYYEVDDSAYNVVLRIFSLVPYDQWDLTEVLTSFAKLDLPETIMQYGEKFIKYLESVENWNDAMRIRLLIIGYLRKYINLHESQEGSGAGNIDSLVLTDSIAQRYHNLIIDIGKHSAYANRAVRLIGSGDYYSAIDPILINIPSLLPDLLIATLEEHANPFEVFSNVAEAMKSNFLGIDLSCQNGRLPNLLFQRNLLHCFMNIFKPYIQEMSPDGVEILVEYCKKYIQEEEFKDSDATPNFLNALAILVNHHPDEAREILYSFFVAAKTPLYFLVRLLSKIGVDIINERVFPMDLLRNSLINGDVTMCVDLSILPAGKEFLQTTAAILMSEGYNIPSQIHPYVFD